MVVFYHQVKDPVGLHMRPAKRIADFQQEVSSQITIEYNGSVAAANKLLKMVTLGAVNGTQIKITVSGENETQDAERFKDFLVRIL